MSIEYKVSEAVRSVLDRINERLSELRALKADVNLLIEKSQKELYERTVELSKRERSISVREEKLEQRLKERYEIFHQKKLEDLANFEFEIEQLRDSAQTFIQHSPSKLVQVSSCSQVPHSGQSALRAHQRTLSFV